MPYRDAGTLLELAVILGLSAVVLIVVIVDVLNNRK